MKQKISPGDLIFFDRQHWPASRDIIEQMAGIVLSVHSRTKGYRKNKREVTVYSLITANGIQNVEHEAMVNIIVNKPE